jgi:hypothetical protein
MFVCVHSFLSQDIHTICLVCIALMQERVCMEAHKGLYVVYVVACTCMQKGLRNGCVYWNMHSNYEHATGHRSLHTCMYAPGCT